MAEYTVKSRIIFDKDHKVDLSSTSDQVRHAIEAVTLPHVPLIDVVGARGEALRVNASAIRLIEDVENKPAGTARVVEI